MDNGNRVGSANGGFQSYRRSKRPTPARSLSPAMELRMGLPAHLNQATAANAQNSECTIREQDQFIPIANVIKIMRRILPPHAKISDDSKVTIQDCVSEFISFITGEANEHCKRDQRKIITAEDVLRAMSNFGFDDFVEPLTFYLQRYREYDAGACGSLRGKPLLFTRPMVHLPPTFQIAHHQYGYFVYPPPMGHAYTQGDASYESTSQCAVADVDSEVESPAKEGKD